MLQAIIGIILEISDWRLEIRNTYNADAIHIDLKPL
jgi:hypothetical protein